MRKGDENMEKKKEPSGIQKAWRQLSIQNQIFLSMFLITLLGVGVLMNIVYKTSIDAIEQNYRASYQSTLKNSSRVMDMNLKNIVDVGRNFLNDEALQQILKKGNEYGGSKFASTDREKLPNNCILHFRRWNIHKFPAAVSTPLKLYRYRFCPFLYLLPEAYGP